MSGHGAEMLAPLCIMAKSLKGKGCAGVVMQAINNPSIFVFGELIDQPNVAALATSADTEATHRLLLLFAYGTYSDYVANAAQLPSLGEDAKRKLKQMSIVSLASSNKVIPYTTLLKPLDFDSVRDLEDAVIDAMNKDVLRGRLDHLREQL